MENLSTTQRDIVLITDIGSVDIDDAFSVTLLVELIKKHPEFKLKGIIATHFFAERRAKIAKLLVTELGRQDIPVYAGFGMIYSPTGYQKELEQRFLSQNSKFPVPIFGLPHGACPNDQKKWFPEFMKGFYDYFNESYINSMKIEPKCGGQFLIEELMQHSPSNKLLVICISPMHDLALVPSKCYENMELWSMGGGFEEDVPKFLSEKRNKLVIPKPGYNWGICPEYTRDVLLKLDKSGAVVNVVSSNLVRNKNVVVPNELYEKMTKLWNLNKDKKGIFGALMKDWEYARKGSALPQHKNLCDPLTVFLALKGLKSCKSVLLRSKIMNDNLSKFNHYMETKEDCQMLEMNIETILINPNYGYYDKNIITSYLDQVGNTNLIYDFDPTIVPDLIKELDSALESLANSKN